MTSSSAVPVPSLTYHNAWADHWREVIGVNVIPAKTKQKKVFIKWSEWQLKPIPAELHEQWKRENAFEEGMAIIVGKVWRGEHAGKYLIFIDCDNDKAIEELCTRNGVIVPIEDIAKRFLIEQHPDDKSKAHVFFYSEIPFVKKSSDVVVLGGREDRDDTPTPAFEVKGEGIHGIAYCTPSVHKTGYRYQIIGTAIPEILAKALALQMMQHLDAICRKYGLRYLELDNNGKGNALVPITDLFKDKFDVMLFRSPNVFGLN